MSYLDARFMRSTSIKVWGLDLCNDGPRICAHHKLTCGLLVRRVSQIHSPNKQLDLPATRLLPILRVGKPPEDRRLPLEAVQRFKT